MSQTRRTWKLLIAIAVFGLVLGGSAAARDQTVLVSEGFGSCNIDLQCPPLPDCEASSFGLFGSCIAECFVGGFPPPGCSGFVSGTTPQDSWEVSGLFAASVPPGTDIPDALATFDVEATRPLPDQLELSVFVTLYNFGVPFEPGQVEVSVFRFSGDPTVFEGVHVPSVFSLVSLGLIDAEDVLFSEELDFTFPPGMDGELFDFTADVTGVPDEEIVVFASHSGSVISVPAISGWRLALLALAILLTSTWMLRRRLSTTLR